MPRLISRWLAIAICLCSLSIAWAAEIPTQTPVAITKFIEGLNSKSYSTARKYISPQFRIQGVPTEYMKRASLQIFGSFPMHLSQVTLKEYKIVNGTPEVIVSVVTDTGMRELTFYLDKDGKVVETSLLQGVAPDAPQNKKQYLYPNAEIEFEQVKGLILVPVELNGVKMKFLVDSGAPVLVINSTFHQENPNIVVGSASGVGGEIQNVGFFKIDDLSWGGGNYRNFEAVSMDLSHLTAELGTDFGGLISKAELEPFECYFDYTTQKLKLHLLNADGSLADSVLPPAKDSIRFELQGHIAVIKAKVGKKILQLGLDTGAETNLLSQKLYGKFRKLLTNTQQDTLRGADTSFSEVYSGDIAFTQAANITFPNMRYVFYDMSHLEGAYGLKVSGLLGAPFLRQRPMSINYRTRWLKFY